MLELQTENVVKIGRRSVYVRKDHLVLRLLTGVVPVALDESILWFRVSRRVFFYVLATLYYMMFRHCRVQRWCRRWVIRRKLEQARLAALMALHHRLGQASGLACLGPDLLSVVLGRG